MLESLPHCFFTVNNCKRPGLALAGWCNWRDAPVMLGAGGQPGLSSVPGLGARGPGAE